MNEMIVEPYKYKHTSCAHEKFQYFCSVNIEHREGLKLKNNFSSSENLIVGSSTGWFIDFQTIKMS